MPHRPMIATTHLIRITNLNTGPAKTNMKALHLLLLGHGWLVHDCMMVCFLICFVVDWLFLQWRLCNPWADHDWLSLSSCWSSVWTGEPGVCCMVSLVYYTFAYIIVAVFWSPSHPLSLLQYFRVLGPLHYALCFSFSFQNFFRFKAKTWVWWQGEDCFNNIQIVACCCKLALGLHTTEDWGNIFYATIMVFITGYWWSYWAGQVSKYSSVKLCVENN